MLPNERLTGLAVSANASCGSIERTWSSSIRLLCFPPPPLLMQYLAVRGPGRSSGFTAP